MGFAEWATAELREWSLWNLRKVKIGKQKFPIKRELNGIPEFNRISSSRRVFENISPIFYYPRYKYNVG